MGMRIALSNGSPLLARELEQIEEAIDLGVFGRTTECAMEKVG